MEKLAMESARRDSSRDPDPADNLPHEYWSALLTDPRALEGPPIGIATRRVPEATPAMLRVSCRRCGRLVEIARADAARLYGAETPVKVVARRLLDVTCQSRTGRYEEDGCWPSVETR